MNICKTLFTLQKKILSFSGHVLNSVSIKVRLALHHRMSANSVFFFVVVVVQRQVDRTLYFISESIQRVKFDVTILTLRLTIYIVKGKLSTQKCVL